MSDAPVQPLPFEIGEGEGVRVGVNGSTSLSIFADEGGRLFRRRGVKGLAGKPPAEAILPHLNALAGDLLANLEMPREELMNRLKELTALAAPPPTRNVEWIVGELKGVRCYFDGKNAFLTEKDLMP